MYFWRIEKLKAEMAARPLSERETLPYLVVFLALYTGSFYLPAPELTLWDRLGTTCSFVLAVAGTLYIYRKNGGAGGQHFLQRYFAIGWVTSVRWAVVVAVFAAIRFITREALGVSSETVSWHDFLFWASLETILCWRIGAHVGDLAARTNTT